MTLEVTSVFRPDLTPEEERYCRNPLDLGR